MPKGIYKRGAINRKPHSEETKRKMSLAHCGKILSKETIERIRLAKTGVKYPNRKKYSRGITLINKICLFCKTPFVTNSRQPKKKYCSNSCCTKDHPETWKYALSKVDRNYQKEIVSSRKGIMHPRWIKDRTIIMEKHRLRGTTEWCNWRNKVFERDNYTCQECKNKGIPIEPHHIIPLRLGFEKVFDINNGITLCRKCHQKTIFKEESFIEKYSQKILTKL